MLFAALIYNRSSLNELLFTLYRFRIEKIQDITCIGVNFIHHIENENEANIHQVWEREKKNAIIYDFSDDVKNNI